MASNYPASLDTTATLPASGSVGANLSTFPHSTLHGNANDAIIAIETELGVAPSDTFTTVKARLDAIGPMGAWTAYTPTFTEGVTITKTVGYARYMRVGRMVQGAFYMTATSAGTGSVNVQIGLPVAIFASSPNNLCLGAAYFSASGGANLIGSLGVLTSTTCGIVLGPGYLGSAALSVTIAVGDIVSGQFNYEANT